MFIFFFFFFFPLGRRGRITGKKGAVCPIRANLFCFATGVADFLMAKVKMPVGWQSIVPTLRVALHIFTLARKEM